MKEFVQTNEAPQCADEAPQPRSPSVIEQLRAELAAGRDFIPANHPAAKIPFALRAYAVEALRKALEKLDRLFTYPVAQEINPRGYELRSVGDLEYAVEIIRAALAGSTEESSEHLPDVGKMIGWHLTFAELEDLHAAVAGVVTAQERLVVDEPARWERLNHWLTRLAEAANERFPANWKGLPTPPKAEAEHG